MTGTVPIITGSIIVKRGLTERPVYFVEVNSTPLVVKGETPAAWGRAGLTDADIQISAKWSSKLMKNVNNKLVNTKLMTATEVQAFIQAASVFFQQGTPQHNNLAAPYNWVKMPYADGLSDAQMYDSDMDAIELNVRNNIIKFADAMIWYDLGRVLAVDIFNGNDDRFNTTTGEWKNFGNVMFLAAGDTRVIGLDTLDPNNARANLNVRGDKAPLKALKDHDARHKFAKNCVISVGTKLMEALQKKNAKTGEIENETLTLKLKFGPNPEDIKRITVSELPKLYLDYEGTLADGIKLGAANLKQYLYDRVRKYKHPGSQKVVPQGILDRMKYLGW